MAQQNSTPSVSDREFSFSEVEVYKSETIGAGAYGAVCKARCNKLQCAAKLLYNALLDVKEHTSNDSDGARSYRTPLSRFKQECQFLSRVNHPNVVQYLGTYSDPDTHVMVLLMELMDESLTHLLDTTATPLPLHLQANIGHDVILAITYLHSNGIIHRDLSSNNVLLTVSRRAKVSDFGMSTLMGSTGVPNTLTLCPGNVSYMPPEALDEPPLYTKSLDVFSFGVLLIQINSRIFPCPSNRFTDVIVISPTSHEPVEAKVSIPEVKRRIKHIQMMVSNNPLLPIVLDCLKDTGNERPTANYLCERFEAVKETVEYKKSSKVVVEPTAECGKINEKVNKDNYDSHIYELDDELPKRNHFQAEKIKQLEDANEQLRERMEEMELELSSNYQLLSIRARELQKVTKALNMKEKQSLRSPNGSSGIEETEMLRKSCHGMEIEMRRLRNVVDDLTRETARYHEQISLQDSTIEDLQSIVNDREDYISSTKAHLLAEIEDNQKLRAEIEGKEKLQEELGKRSFLVKNDSIEHESRDGWINPSRPTKVHEVERELKLKEKSIKDLKKFISIKDAHITSLQQQLQLMESKLKSKSGSLKPPVKPRSNLTIQVDWKMGTTAPCFIQTGSTAANRTSVYCRPANSSEIYEYALQVNKWRQVEKCPSNACTLVTIDDVLTAVGGMSTRRLLSLVQTGSDGNSEQWDEMHPPMSVERFNATAAYSNNKLIVAGGFGRGWSSIADVEVLDVSSQVWSTAKPLPYPIYSASAAVCNNRAYIVGGYFEKARGHFSVLSCPVEDLVEGGQSKDDAEALPLSPWKKIADLPVCRSTCMTFRGKLAAVGGRRADGFHSSALYIYNTNSNKWTSVTDIMCARSECHAAVVNDTTFVIAGGYTEDGLTDDVEIGDIVT